MLTRLKHLPGYLTDPGVSIAKKLALVVGVIYILSPVDVIPDVLPIVGWLDDLGVMGLLVSWLLKELTGYVEMRDAVETPRERRPMVRDARFRDARRDAREPLAE